MRTIWLLVALALVVAACGDDPSAAGTGGTWHAAAPMPLAPRWSPLVAWTGQEALVLGGGTDSPCPPTASCATADPMARDGAAYDPETDTWRPIADAPVPVGYWFRPAVVGRTLVLFDGGRGWWAYDIAGDAWARLPAAPLPAADSGSLTVAEGRVYAVARSRRVLVLDVAHREWSVLPADDQRPRLRPSGVLATGAAIFACGPDPGVRQDGDTPRFTVVDRWDGRAWSRFSRTGSVGDLCQHWTGARLLDVDIQVATGLDGDPPYGGRLDPATGEWSALPHVSDPVQATGTGWSPVAADGARAAVWGYVYDDTAEAWTRLGRPDSAVDGQQSAVWAGDRLLVFGGVDEATAYQDPKGLSAETWVWTPGVASAP